MDSEAKSVRLQLISNATLRRMSGTRDPFWTLRRALFTSIAAGFGGGILAILYFAG